MHDKPISIFVSTALFILVEPSDQSAEPHWWDESENTTHSAQDPRRCHRIEKLQDPKRKWIFSKRDFCQTSFDITGVMGWVLKWVFGIVWFSPTGWLAFLREIANGDWLRFWQNIAVSMEQIHHTATSWSFQEIQRNEHVTADKRKCKKKKSRKKKEFYLLNCSKLIMFESGEVEACQDGCWLLTPPTLKLKSEWKCESEIFIWVRDCLRARFHLTNWTRKAQKDVDRRQRSKGTKNKHPLHPSRQFSAVLIHVHQASIKWSIRSNYENTNIFVSGCTMWPII